MGSATDLVNGVLGIFEGIWDYAINGIEALYGAVRGLLSS